MALEPGTVIGDKYCITRRLGAGGMGEVWAAENTQLGNEVAIKIMLPAGVLSREVYARFKREAQVLGRIRSDYVARVLDFISNKSIGLAMVMELIPGQSLSAILAAEGKLSLETMVAISLDVARGLRDLHAANIVHRDLKPGNVVVQPRPGQRARATLIDFGVSRILSNPGEEEITAITRDDRVLGTLEYMAPEQIIGSRSATAQSDLYALGAMMYRAVTGHHCFGNLTEGKLVAAKLNQEAAPLDTGRTDPASVRFSAMVARLLNRRPRDRFSSAEELIDELEAIEEVALAPKTAPVIQVSMVTSYDEPPTESLSLDAKASILMAHASDQEPASSSSSHSSLTPAIAPRHPSLGHRVSMGSIAMIMLMVAGSAAGGVVVGMSLSNKGMPPQVPLAASRPAPAPSSYASAALNASASSPPVAASAAPALAASSAAPAELSAVASNSATPVAVPSASAFAAAPRPVVVRKPKPKVEPAASGEAAPGAAATATATAAPTSTLMLPETP